MIEVNPVAKVKKIEAHDALVAHIASKDYGRIEQAIAFIRREYRTQPSLTEIAQHVHLSEIHFQKMFTAWAGISPKRFVKYLTLAHAKAHLAQGMSVIDAALESGLSGSGRLHDLCVTMEAVTPGEYKSMGHGLTIEYAVHDSQFGKVFIATTDRGICQLNFLPQSYALHDYEADSDGMLAQLKANWPDADIRWNATAGSDVLPCIFRSPNDEMAESGVEIKLLAKGTNFQVQVWQALLQLPYGQITSYQRIADALGKPTAVRAVASAIGANSLAYIIPCHRVLRSNAQYGGYRWGLDKKAALLAYEQSRLSLE